MDNLFEGLEAFGMEGIVKNINVFDEEEKESVKHSQPKVLVKEIPDEDTFIFEKTMTCPVCGQQFKTKTVRTGKARFITSDTDLRPVYEGIDTIKYDAIVCLHCGYAATARNYNDVTAFQRKEIKEKITANFKGMTNDVGVYSYKTAIDRMKMVLLTNVIKHSKISERAYSCLKIAWLYRGMAETFDKTTVDYEKYIEKFNREEMNFIKSAYEGFTTAIQKELPPICNMDNLTINYLLSELARKCKDYDNGLKFASYILASRGASAKIKEKARNVRDSIKAEMDKKDLNN